MPDTKEKAEIKFERYDLLLITGGAILLLAFIYALRDMLSPPVISLLMLMFLLPLKSHKIKSFLIFMTIALFLLWFIAHSGTILMPFILSLLFAYLFDPVIEFLESWRIPRTLAVLIIVILVLSILALGLIFLIPQLIRELKELINMSIDYSGKIADWVETDLIAFLNRLNIDNQKIQETALNELPKRFQILLQAFFKGALNLTSAVSTAFGQLLNFLLIPFLFFYILKDFDRIKLWVRDLLPLDQGWVFEKYIKKIDIVLSGYFRGQLIVCFIVATLTSLGLFVFGIKYSLLIGIMAGVLNLIPHIGLIITLIFGQVIFD